MINTQTYDDYEDPDYLIWAKTGRAIELIWTGNNFALAVIKLITIKIKYKGFVRLEWI